jgi:ribosomal protein L20
MIEYEYNDQRKQLKDFDDRAIARIAGVMRYHSERLCDLMERLKPDDQDMVNRNAIRLFAVIKLRSPNLRFTIVQARETVMKLCKFMDDERRGK